MKVSVSNGPVVVAFIGMLIKSFQGKHKIFEIKYKFRI